MQSFVPLVADRHHSLCPNGREILHRKKKKKKKKEPFADVEEHEISSCQRIATTVEDFSQCDHCQIASIYQPSSTIPIRSHRSNHQPSHHYHRRVCFEHRQQENSSRTIPTNHHHRKKSSMSDLSSTVNYDESLVPKFQLPNLIDASIDAFADALYGRSPPAPTSWRIESRTELWRDESTRCELIHCEFSLSPNVALDADILLHAPVGQQARAVLFGLNFDGNHATSPRENVPITSKWVPVRAPGVLEGVNRASELSRGFRASRWPAEFVVASSQCAIATCYCGDFALDDPELAKMSPLLRANSSCGTIGAWSWGLMRMCDVLRTLFAPDVTMAVMGHSRLGKAALWAGAQHESIDVTISNNSGCCGAALSRRRFGETLRHIKRFPHWWGAGFDQFIDNEDALPVDQHQLLALCATNRRRVYVCSASKDLWADPRGEFLAWRAASRTDVEMPPATCETVSSADRRFGYHLRDGEHELTLSDVERFVAFVTSNNDV
jgi:hypothetical protein